MSCFRHAVLLACLLVSSCANLVSGVTGQLADDLASAILNAEDVATVREGVPAYLLLIDSFLRSSPDDQGLLIAASSLNGSYSVFTTGDRAKLLTTKSLEYASRAACVEDERLCDLRGNSFEVYTTIIESLQADEIEVAYTLGVAWTGWIQSHSDDWNAIAELSRVKLLMAKVIELDETWENGSPHLYMGGLETVLPASMGGKPEKGKQHFERALELADGQYLMTKVIFAEQYARLVFDQALHDQLLNEVISADPVVEGMTLTNRIAQERAKELLADSNDYF